MMFDFPTKKEVKITMFDYINTIITIVPGVHTTKGRFVTPTSDHLNDVRDIDDEKAIILTKKKKMMTTH